MLYRELAPISNEAWNEIDEKAKEVLKSYLSARKVVKVVGPKGLDYNVVTEGRLTNIEEAEGVSYGRYKVLPLTELRVEFEMKRWELDNISRGAKDIDYEPLEKAMKGIALFEENAIYNGLESNSIKGIKNSVELQEISLGKEPTAIMEAIAKGLVELRKSYVEGPFTLVVNEEAYKRIIAKETAYPLDERIEKLIGGKIVFNHVIDGAYLLPYNHDDLELTIGRDFSIGYQTHNNETVRFFVMESFTFRVLDPSIIVKYNLK
ncbi:family 1 encapsulin nanocompartment shell protein [Tissierella praeacuta]|uniref:family 1 encapsulin nanocompartment shell protein n=1 Tax=Tissierella praeacuta TaxID=43131 RepID=UPI00333F5F78